MSDADGVTNLRVYAPEECGADGYPFAWHQEDGRPGIKHCVREAAAYRCVRCDHPYPPGSGEWSRCDFFCGHSTPIRIIDHNGSEVERFLEGGLLLNGEAVSAGRLAIQAEAGGDHIEAQWRILTTHHLTMQKADCRWWNLAALCQRCHLTIQGRVDMNRVYPLEHSAWFKPYAAGWYAWTYLGLELDRAETMERLDELLALERMA